MVKHRTLLKNSPAILRDSNQRQAKRPPNSFRVRQQCWRTAASAAIVACFVLVSPAAFGETIEHQGASFHVYRLDPSTETLQLHLAGKGTPGKFTEIAEKLRSKGKKPKLIMNSGIFERTFLPSGLHVSDGKVISELDTMEFEKETEDQLTPNFYLKPNGVFLFRTDGYAAIKETSVYATSKFPKPDIAVQSGPMLVIEGKIHPVFGKNSESKHYRNGVGVSKEGEVVFACSVIDPEIGMTNLYNFAHFFREKLDCPNALYLDGAISDIYIKGETGDIRDRNLFSGIFTITNK